MPNKTPITSLKGSENLPQRNNSMQYDNFDAGEVIGNNVAVDKLSNCAIVLDEEEIAERLFNIRQEELYGKEGALTWRDLLRLGGKDEWMIKAKALCANAQKIFRIERIKQ